MLAPKPLDKLEKGSRESRLVRGEGEEEGGKKEEQEPAASEAAAAEEE